MKNFRLLSAFLIFCFSVHCGTVSSFAYSESYRHRYFIYSGLQKDFDLIGDPKIFPAGPIFILDLPFSFVLDTALLPFTVLHFFIRKDSP
ncbi:MAG TPA: YceK/YidQ family lipoprotein, partial [Leptospiraceae bacterium]|nr:YceK/YidQ family lipoprotein [Leptospiraceae bacterium]